MSTRGCVNQNLPSDYNKKITVGTFRGVKKAQQGSYVIEKVIKTQLFLINNVNIGLVTKI